MAITPVQVQLNDIINPRTTLNQYQQIMIDNDPNNNHIISFGDYNNGQFINASASTIELIQNRYLLRLNNNHINGLPAAVINALNNVIGNNNNPIQIDNIEIDYENECTVTLKTSAPLNQTIPRIILSNNKITYVENVNPGQNPHEEFHELYFQPSTIQVQPNHHQYNSPHIATQATIFPADILNSAEFRNNFSLKNLPANLLSNLQYQEIRKIFISNGRSLNVIKNTSNNPPQFFYIDKKESGQGNKELYLRHFDINNVFIDRNSDSFGIVTKIRQNQITQANCVIYNGEGNAIHSDLPNPFSLYQFVNFLRGTNLHNSINFNGLLLGNNHISNYQTLANAPSRHVFLNPTQPGKENALNNFISNSHNNLRVIGNQEYIEIYNLSNAIKQKIDDSNVNALRSQNCALGLLDMVDGLLHAQPNQPQIQATIEPLITASNLIYEAINEQQRLPPNAIAGGNVINNISDVEAQQGIDYVSNLMTPPPAGNPPVPIISPAIRAATLLLDVAENLNNPNGDIHRAQEFANMARILNNGLNPNLSQQIYNILGIPIQNPPAPPAPPAPAPQNPDQQNPDQQNPQNPDQQNPQQLNAENQKLNKDSEGPPAPAPKEKRKTEEIDLLPVAKMFGLLFFMFSFLTGFGGILGLIIGLGLSSAEFSNPNWKVGGYEIDDVKSGGKSGGLGFFGKRAQEKFLEILNRLKNEWIESHANDHAFIEDYLKEQSEKLRKMQAYYENYNAKYGATQADNLTQLQEEIRKMEEAHTEITGMNISVSQLAHDKIFEVLKSAAKDNKIAKNSLEETMEQINGSIENAQSELNELTIKEEEAIGNIHPRANSTVAEHVRFEKELMDVKLRTFKTMLKKLIVEFQGLNLPVDFGQINIEIEKLIAEKSKSATEFKNALSNALTLMQNIKAAATDNSPGFDLVP